MCWIENGSLGRFPFRAVIRFGSQTKTEDIYPTGAIEVNSVEAVQNSRSKLLMKECFAKAGVPQSRWFGICNDNGDKYMIDLSNNQSLISKDNLPYPIVAKRVFGFKGRGMFLLETQEDLEKWLTENNTIGYYLESYKNFNKEYRLHCTKDGCFYSARKMLKSDTPDDKRWYRNDSNCIWVAEYKVIMDGDKVIGYDETTPNEAFDKPVNWNKIEEDCVKALKEVGLDVGEMRRL